MGGYIYGVPMLVIYIFLPASFVLSCWYIGFYYDVKGIWKEETSHANANLNPEFVALCQLVDRMDNKLDELTKKLNELELNVKK
jgi:hypothetical protein